MIKSSGFHRALSFTYKFGHSPMEHVTLSPYMIVETNQVIKNFGRQIHNEKT